MVRWRCWVRLGGAWCYLFIPLGMGGVEGFWGGSGWGGLGQGLGSFTWCNWVFRLVAPWRPSGRPGSWVLGVYPFLRVLRIAVPPLRRVTFFKRQKGNRKGLLLRSALAGSGSFAPGLIRAQRLRFASLHLLPLCSTSSNGRCAPTPGSIPPLSLPTSPVDQDQKRYSSLRSLWSGAASPRAAALLCLGFCRSEPARDAARPGLRGIEFV